MHSESVWRKTSLSHREPRGSGLVPTPSEHFAPLKLTEDLLEHRTERLRLNRIKYRAHRGITRHALDAIDPLQVVFSPLLIKGKQRRRLSENRAKADMS